MIEQKSNNNLLNDSQIQKTIAQKNYDKTAKDLENQLQIIRNIERKLLQKQQDKEAS